ncbi:MAG: hypothetical protein IPH35_18250 [Rhodoferax sp.]|nr:hypothetical protein [Rhodoferax sp.]
MGGTVEGVEIDSYTLGVWIGRPDGTPNPGFFGANVAAPLSQPIRKPYQRRFLGGFVMRS